MKLYSQAFGSLRLLILLFLLTGIIFLPLVNASAQDQPKDQPEDQPKGQSNEEVAAANVGPTSKSGPSQSTSDKRILLKGQATYLVPRGTAIKLKLATVPTYGMKLLQKDLDGNFYPAKSGQEITAKITEDLYVDDKRIIPEGTIFHGHVSKIAPPRHVGRPGWLNLSFDYLTRPDGRRFAFKAQADNFQPSTLKTKAKGFGIIAAHAAGGAIIGALVSYEIFGLQHTISMHGYNIAAAAAGGALLATGYAIMRRGPAAVLEPGDDLHMKIDSDLLMPAAVEPVPRQAPKNIVGLNIDIEKTKLIRDGLGGQLLVVKGEVTNDSDENFSSIDLFVQDSNGNRGAVCSSYEDDSEILFNVEPHSRQHVNLCFMVEYPKLKQQLVWLEHTTRKICYRKSLP